MGYCGKYEEKLEAQRLRQKGLSYSEIITKINVSKDTLSRWCRDIELTPDQEKRLLDKKLFGQRKGSLVAAVNKRRKREKIVSEIYASSKKEVGKITLRDKFIFGASLYSAEGDKGEGKIAFTNSNPKIIKFMMFWFRTFLKIPESKFRGSIWLHEGLNEKNSKLFWSTLTGIPLDQFHKTYIAKNRIESKKIRKNIHQHGVFAIVVSDTQKHRQVMGWISALLNDKIIRVL